MARVTNVTLHDPTISGDTATVVVDYTVAFSPDELNQPHRVAVELWAKEVDGEPEWQQWYAAPLYTFRFGNTFLGRHPYRTLVPTAATVTETVSNTLSRTTLDEDPGTDSVHAGGYTFQVPRKDEIAARVVVGAVGDSETVQFYA